MNLFDIFLHKAKFKTANIGIGLGEFEEHNIKILKTSVEFLKENNSKVFLFGSKDANDIIKKNKFFKSGFKRIELITTEEPVKEILSYLNDNIISVIVRGNLSSNSFLKYLKSYFNIAEIDRLALLETFDGVQFFFGPVGIDECNSKERKIRFLNKSIALCNFLDIPSKISILSGGRLSDVGREQFVDHTIYEAEEIVTHLKEIYPDLEIKHDEILIENAIQKRSNIIIAPDGISGNLIYRTLVHLGGGKAFGAIYMGLDKIIVDTSRVGPSSEIYGALILSLALTTN